VPVRIVWPFASMPSKRDFSLRSINPSRRRVYSDTGGDLMAEAWRSEASNRFTRIMGLRIPQALLRRSGESGETRQYLQRAHCRVTNGRGPLVSILIPAFNAQKWIAETLRSAIAQTWMDKEIIVVDDGSTDRTLAIARRFEPEGVRAVNQNNQGAAAARNTAYSLSRGEYIQWLDADDVLAPDKICKQMQVLVQCPSKLILASCAWGRFMYRYERSEFAPTALWCDLAPAEWLLRKMEGNVFMQTATWLVSRELTEAAGCWDTALQGDDDGEYFCRVLLASEGIKFVPDAHVFYRTPFYTSLGYLGESANSKLEAHWRSMQMHVAYLRAMDQSERAKGACVRYLKNSLLYFYPDRTDILKEMEQMVAGLGGQLGTPILAWKYSWIPALFGWKLAKRAQSVSRRTRWSLEKLWDRLLLLLRERTESTGT
jgi:glycosyltransferase involved in cell wall biosynthesis